MNRWETANYVGLIHRKEAGEWIREAERWKRKGIKKIWWGGGAIIVRKAQLNAQQKGLCDISSFQNILWGFQLFTSRCKPRCDSTNGYRADTGRLKERKSEKCGHKFLQCLGKCAHLPRLCPQKTIQKQQQKLQAEKNSKNKIYMTETDATQSSGRMVALGTPRCKFWHPWLQKWSVFQLWTRNLGRHVWPCVRGKHHEAITKWSGIRSRPRDQRKA